MKNEGVAPLFSKKAAFLILIAILIIACLSAGCTGQTKSSPTSSLMTRTTVVPSPTSDPAAREVRVTLDTSRPGQEIPADFLGLSYEAYQINRRAFYPNSTSFMRLLQNLGPGVLRFGGNSLEYTYFIQNGGPVPQGTQGVVRPDDLDRVFAFANQAGWKVILGLNLGQFNPQMAADEAAYASTHDKGRLLAFEIGNEPDFFNRNGLRPENWNAKDYRAEFDLYRNAIIAKDPGARICGPVTAGNMNWFKDFIPNEYRNISFADNHYYPLTANPNETASPRYASIVNMLSDDTYIREENSISQFSAVSAADNLPLRYAETNDATDGGKNGVSATFAASLWTADYLFILAENGVSGANFHGGFYREGDTPTPLYFDGTQYSPAPLYYGMLFFHQAGTGRIIPATADQGANLSVHAVLDDHGTLRVALINRDLYRPVNVVIPVVHAGKASVMRMSAASASATSGITLGGAEVAPDGSFNPQVVEHPDIQSGNLRLYLPAASAAMITLPS